MKNSITHAAEYMKNAHIVSCITGAGISVESGIPPFRGKGGLWEKFDPMTYAHIRAFTENPHQVWDVLLREMIQIIHKAMPNDAHKGLAALEKMGKLKTVITQNIDGLHQKAGNSDVVEFHGNFADYSCMDCGSGITSHDIDLTVIPPRCGCGGIYRPDCIFFGEMIPEDVMWRAKNATDNCDVMLVIGTSATVQPAAAIPFMARQSGATIIEINPEKTPLTDQGSDLFLKGKAGAIINQLVQALESPEG